jgi:hypothetical protein
MGLLSWRRSARGSDRTPEAPPAAAAAAGSHPAPEQEVIRASTLTDVPEWAKVPPLAPLLPEMPSVVSRHFEDSLVSWQPPERFLAPLGHSVSPSAPAGIIEGIAVLSPGPAVSPPEAASAFPAEGPAPTEQPLTLAVPSAPASQARRQPQVTTRRLDLPHGPVVARI